MRPRIVAGALDLAAVVAFAAIGRRTHGEGVVVGLVTTTAPFAVGLATGWVAARAWRRPLAPSTGGLVAGITLAGGMAVRRYVFDEGTAAAFVVVAGLFLTTTIVGWRLVHILITRFAASKRIRLSFRAPPADESVTGPSRPGMGHERARQRNDDVRQGPGRRR